MPVGRSVEGPQTRTRAPSAERDVGPRHARMQDVAADGDDEALDPALVAADGERVEQRLCRMLMGAIARVDHRAAHLAGQEVHGTGLVVPHHDDVRVHGVQRRGRVDQRLALFDRRGRDRHVHHVRPKPLAGDLERGLGAGRGLEEQVDLRATAQGGPLLLDLPRQFDGLVGQVEQPGQLPSRQAFDAEQVAVREDRKVGHGLPSIRLARSPQGRRGSLGPVGQGRTPCSACLRVPLFSRCTPHPI